VLYQFGRTFASAQHQQTTELPATLVFGDFDAFFTSDANVRSADEAGTFRGWLVVIHSTFVTGP